MVATTKKPQTVGGGMTLGQIIAVAIVLTAVCLLLLIAILVLTHLVRSTRKSLPLHDNDYVKSELMEEEKARTKLRTKLTGWFLAMLTITVIYLGYYGPVLLFAAMLPKRP
ncbi:hypothetical protein CQ020_01800 [Arthrobacter sp. MYb23]|nr:hypothetical protein CQ038_00980 [Arthrobacter sp. MYb51]PRB99542.1 hypothetical protein CQ020_01800 [Arthrobacter sp. MYb23]